MGGECLFYFIDYSTIFCASSNVSPMTISSSLMSENFLDPIHPSVMFDFPDMYGQDTASAHNDAVPLKFASNLVFSFVLNNCATWNACDGSAYITITSGWNVVSVNGAYPSAFFSGGICGNASVVLSVNPNAS